MKVSRRGFFAFLGAGAAAAAVPGCSLPKGKSRCVRAKIALQLYSIRGYIGGKKDKSGKLLFPGVGLAKAFENVAAIGYKGVEFAGYYDADAKTLRKMLADAGLKACGTHVACDAYGLDTKRWTYDSDVLKKTCEFNLGCRIGIHNHTWEHTVFMRDGTSFWDYFFSNTSEDVCMEQDVGWSTCAGVDPKDQYRKYPHRSPTLHAKENGMGKNVKQFDAILGRPGKPDAAPVDWNGLIPVTEKDGVEWYVVECERHVDDLSAVLPSYDFLAAKFRS